MFSVKVRVTVRVNAVKVMALMRSILPGRGDALWLIKPALSGRLWLVKSHLGDSLWLIKPATYELVFLIS